MRLRRKTNPCPTERNQEDDRRLQALLDQSVRAQRELQLSIKVLRSVTQDLANDDGSATT